MNDESLADIIAEMREQANEPTIESLGEVFPPVGTEDVKDWADRIEAAAKRERFQRDKVSFHCGDCAKFGCDCDAGDVDGNEDCIACEKFVRRALVPGNAAAMRDTHGVTGDGWYGFDLDGTLARYDGWKGIDHIGEPISAMVALIKRLHAEGKIVKIMTARVAPRDDTIDGHDARYYVCKWCAKHLGFTPDVVFQKDARMIQLYDDRVKQVVPNTGILVENLAMGGDTAKLREMLKASRDYFVALREKVPGSLSEQYLTRRIADIDAALAAPPRNCDVFKDWKVAQETFKTENWQKAQHFLSIADAFKWMFATGGDHDGE